MLSSLPQDQSDEDLKKMQFVFKKKKKRGYSLNVHDPQEKEHISKRLHFSERQKTSDLLLTDGEWKNPTETTTCHKTHENQV